MRWERVMGHERMTAIRLGAVWAGLSIFGGRSHSAPRRRWPTLLLFQVLGIVACGQVDTGSVQAGSGDTTAGSIRPDTFVLTMDTTVDEQLPEAEILLVTRARLLRAELEWEFGTLDGPEHTHWADITDIATDSAGNTYALDRTLTRVRVLSPDGDFIAEPLREGDGPLEIQSPVGLEFIRGDTLVVYSGSQVSFFTGGPRDLRYAGGFIRGSNAFGLCATDSLLFSRAFSVTPPGTVEVLDFQGSSVRFFGDLYEHPEPGVQVVMSYGPLACSGGGTRVVSSFENSPFLDGYTTSGERAWVTRLSDFTPLEVVRTAQGGYVPRDGQDRVLAVTPLSDDMVLVQVARMDERVPGERGLFSRPIHTIDTYLLSALTGVGLYVGAELREIAHATERRLFVKGEEMIGGLEEVGYPQVEVYRW